MSAIYGYQSSARDDPLVRIVETAMAVGFDMATPERAMLLKIFPFCKPTLIDEKILTFCALMQY